MEKTIKVTGKGKISLKPDLIRLTLNLNGVREKYDEAVALSSESTNEIRRCLLPLGFTRNSLKTLYFDISVKYESFRDKNDDYKTRFAGYEYRHEMKLEFEADNSLLGKVFAALSDCAAHPEFSVQYTVKDLESAKNKLLCEAVSDSKQKAHVLATAADVKLGDILLIDYSWNEIEFVSNPLGKNLMCRKSVSGSEIDIEPDDIDASDTVTVVWQLLA